MDKPAQTILVVDTEVLARTAIAAYLRDCGYRVLEAASYTEALTALSEHRFEVSVVLADAELDEAHSGFDLARWIRQNEDGIKVVLASALERTASAAADLCENGPELRKPYDPQLVIQRIKRQKAGVG